jgi:peroxiredoxin
LEFEKRKIKLISIANDEVPLLRRLKEENNIKIDIIADKDAKIADDYDVCWVGPKGGEIVKVKQAVPSKFLINRNREIIWKYICKEKTDRPSIKLMMDAIYLNK